MLMLTRKAGLPVAKSHLGLLAVIAFFAIGFASPSFAQQADVTSRVFFHTNVFLLDDFSTPLVDRITAILLSAIDGRPATNTVDLDGNAISNIGVMYFVGALPFIEVSETQQLTIGSSLLKSGQIAVWGTNAEVGANFGNVALIGIGTNEANGGGEIFFKAGSGSAVETEIHIYPRWLMTFGNATVSNIFSLHADGTGTVGHAAGGGVTNEIVNWVAMDRHIGRRPVVTVTGFGTNYAVLSTNFGTTFVAANESNMTFDLPSVSTADLGLWYRFTKTHNHTVFVNAADSDVVDRSTVADNQVWTFVTNEPWNSVTVQLVSETNWAIIAQRGLWTND